MDDIEIFLLLNIYLFYCLYVNYWWINRDICIFNLLKWKIEFKNKCILCMCGLCVVKDWILINCVILVLF